MKTIKRTRISDLLKTGNAGVEVNVRGWVRTRRSSKQVAFVALNDGSTINNVQIVIDVDKFDEELVKQFTKGACLSVNGMLEESIGGGQSVEIQATDPAGVSHLRKGQTSIRDSAKLPGFSITTVQRVKASLEVTVR